MSFQMDCSSDLFWFEKIHLKSILIKSWHLSNTVCRPKYANTTQDQHEKTSFNKRQASGDKNILKKNRCHLALVADYKFFRSIGNSNVKQTTAYLVSLIIFQNCLAQAQIIDQNSKQVNIVGAINSIYTNTMWRFNEPSRSDENNFGFLVEKVIVLATPTADQINHYNNIESPTDADKILEVCFS